MKAGNTVRFHWHPTYTVTIQVPSNNEYDIPVHAQYWQPSLIDSEIYSYMERNQFNIFHHSDVQILNAIGEGEFGLVCKGECKLRGQVVHVAVKRAKEDNIDTSTTKLLQEAAILGQFHHKNVIKLIGIAKLDETENVCIYLLIGLHYSRLSHHCCTCQSQSPAPLNFISLNDMLH